MKRYMLLSIFIGCMFVLLAACNGPGSTSTSHTATTTPANKQTPTPLPQTSVQSIPTAMSYYQAIKAKDYNTAYTYLDSNATMQNGQKLTNDAFLQLARAQDSNYGSINTVDMIPGSNDGSQIVVTVERSAGMRYHVHLTLKKEGGSWKILSLDRI
ncbi:MAG TPA: DUF3828 domain-containing protein [Ktedonobacteraceae bacterium]|jgi:hypothetical protein